MKSKLLYSITAAAALLAAALRVYNRAAAYGGEELPQSGHVSTWILAVMLILGAAALIFIARGLTGCPQNAAVLEASSGAHVIGLISALLLLISALLRLLSAIADWPSVWDFLYFLLGALSAVFMVFSVRRRHDPDAFLHPAMELLPIVYLLVLLVVEFKGWSLDPIILDYFPALFALIFALLGFYYSAGFFFGAGKPRRSAFCAAAAIMFSAAALTDALLSADASEILLYEAVIFWMLPLLTGVASHVGTAVPAPEESPAE